MRTFSSALWILAGVLQIAAGVVCIGSPSIAMGLLSVVIGLLMLASGIVDIVAFIWTKDEMYGAGWILLEGILTVILALLILFHDAFLQVAIVLIFAFWLLFSGISRVIASFELRKFGVIGWGWDTVIGILLAAGGILSLSRPVITTVGVGVLVGIALILLGLLSLSHGVYSRRFFF